MSPYFSLFGVLLVLPLICLISMLADAPGRRGLHGRITGTMVLDLRPAQPPPVAAATPPLPDQGSIPV